MNYKYWMVHNPTQAKPTMKHDDAKSAFDEAERLAAANPGQVFNVLESTYAFRTEKPRVLRESIEAAPLCDNRSHFVTGMSVTPNAEFSGPTGGGDA